MPVSLVNVAMIASESLMQLEYQLVAGALMYRDKTADFSKVGGYAVGNSVSIKTRPDFRVDEFAGSINRQDSRESYADFAIEKHFDVSAPWTSAEMAMNIDSLSEQFIRPAMISMSQKIDTYLLSKAWLSRGLYTSADPLSSAADIALARKQANHQQIEKGGRIGLVNSDLEAAMLGQDIFHRFDTRGAPSVTALQEADMGRMMGINWYGSENFTDAVVAPGDGVGVTVTTPTGVQNAIGTSVLHTTATTGQFEAGDRILVAGMKRPLVVSTQTAATAVEIPLSNQIDELVPVTAAITTISSGDTSVTKQGIILEPGSFAYAAPPLDAPGGVDASVASANGMSIRVVRDYDIDTKTETISFDLLIGATCYDPRKSVVIAKSA